ncbi:MAG: hypothetical protein P9M13_02410 [Candidatus Ancaeobacter aquaticus]|nr:hypothetical protein [Candidatus Ancaeobacter aquaticus]
MKSKVKRIDVIFIKVVVLAITMAFLCQNIVWAEPNTLAPKSMLKEEDLLSLDKIVKGMSLREELGGKGRGGRLEAPFVGSIWINAGSFENYYKFWVDGKRVKFQRYDRDRKPLGEVKGFDFGESFSIGSVTEKRFTIQVKEESGRNYVTIEDLNTPEGTVVVLYKPIEAIEEDASGLVPINIYEKTSQLKKLIVKDIRPAKIEDVPAIRKLARHYGEFNIELIEIIVNEKNSWPEKQKQISGLLEELPDDVKKIYKIKPLNKFMAKLEDNGKLIEPQSDKVQYLLESALDMETKDEVDRILNKAVDVTYDEPYPGIPVLGVERELFNEIADKLGYPGYASGQCLRANNKVDPSFIMVVKDGEGKVPISTLKHEVQHLILFWFDKVGILASVGKIMSSRVKAFKEFREEICSHIFGGTDIISLVPQAFVDEIDNKKILKTAAITKNFVGLCIRIAEEKGIPKTDFLHTAIQSGNFDELKENCLRLIPFSDITNNEIIDVLHELYKSNPPEYRQYYVEAVREFIKKSGIRIPTDTVEVYASLLLRNDKSVSSLSGLHNALSKFSLFSQEIFAHRINPDTKKEILLGGCIERIPLSNKSIRFLIDQYLNIHSNIFSIHPEFVSKSTPSDRLVRSLARQYFKIRSYISSSLPEKIAGYNVDLDGNLYTFHSLLLENMLMPIPLDKRSSVEFAEDFFGDGCFFNIKNEKLKKIYEDILKNCPDLRRAFKETAEKIIAENARVYGDMNIPKDKLESEIKERSDLMLALVGEVVEEKAKPGVTVKPLSYPGWTEEKLETAAAVLDKIAKEHGREVVVTTEGEIGAFWKNFHYSKGKLYGDIIKRLETLRKIETLNALGLGGADTAVKRFGSIIKMIKAQLYNPEIRMEVKTADGRINISGLGWRSEPLEENPLEVNIIPLEEKTIREASGGLPTFSIVRKEGEKRIINVYLSNDSNSEVMFIRLFHEIIESILKLELATNGFKEEQVHPIVTGIFEQLLLDERSILGRISDRNFAEFAAKVVDGDKNKKYFEGIIKETSTKVDEIEELDLNPIIQKHLLDHTYNAELYAKAALKLINRGRGRDELTGINSRANFLLEAANEADKEDKEDSKDLARALFIETICTTDFSKVGEVEYADGLSAFKIILGNTTYFHILPQGKYYDALDILESEIDEFIHDLRLMDAKMVFEAYKNILSGMLVAPDNGKEVRNSFDKYYRNIDKIGKKIKRETMIDEYYRTEVISILLEEDKSARDLDLIELEKKIEKLRTWLGKRKPTEKIPDITTCFRLMGPEIKSEKEMRYLIGRIQKGDAMAGDSLVGYMALCILDIADGYTEILAFDVAVNIGSEALLLAAREYVPNYKYGKFKSFYPYAKSVIGRALDDAVRDRWAHRLDIPKSLAARLPDYNSLKDELGYPPTVDEIAQNLGLIKRDAKRMSAAMKKYIDESAEEVVKADEEIEKTLKAYYLIGASN